MFGYFVHLFLPMSHIKRDLEVCLCPSIASDLTVSKYADAEFDIALIGT